MKLTAEQIIRNINLYLLSDIELEEPYCSIYKDLNSCFENLIKYESDYMFYFEMVFYGKSKNDLYIRYHEKSGDIELDYTNVWSVFESKYDLSYDTIQGITTWYIVNTLQLKGTTNGGIYHNFKDLGTKTCTLKEEGEVN